MADTAYAEKMAEMKAALGDHLASIPHSFPLEDDRLNSPVYQELSTAAREQNTVEDIEWFTRDHGQMVWPPEKEQ